MRLSAPYSLFAVANSTTRTAFVRSFFAQLRWLLNVTSGALPVTKSTDQIATMIVTIIRLDITQYQMRVERIIEICFYPLFAKHNMAIMFSPAHYLFAWFDSHFEKIRSQSSIVSPSIRSSTARPTARNSPL